MNLGQATLRRRPDVSIVFQAISQAIMEATHARLARIRMTDIRTNLGRRFVRNARQTRGDGTIRVAQRTRLLQGACANWDTGLQTLLNRTFVRLAKLHGHHQVVFFAQQKKKKGHQTRLEILLNHLTSSLFFFLIKFSLALDLF